MDAQVIGIESAQAEENPGARKRRSRATQADRREDVRRVKTSVLLSEEAWERLQHHAIRERKHPSELIERLITMGLRSVVVSVRQNASSA